MALKATVIQSPLTQRPLNLIPQRIGIAFLSSLRNRNRNRNRSRDYSLQWHKNRITNKASNSLRYRPLNLSLSAAMSEESSSSSAAKTVRVVVKGRVQGVFYRNWTIENAQVLGLRGWVRNRRDGSVEALFSGNHDSVAEMEMRCRRGPPAAVVTSFQAFPSSEDPGSGFDRKPTV